MRTVSKAGLAGILVIKKIAFVLNYEVKQLSWLISDYLSKHLIQSGRLAKQIILSFAKLDYAFEIIGLYACQIKIIAL